MGGWAEEEASVVSNLNIMETKNLQEGQKIALKIAGVVFCFALAKGLAGFFSGSVVLLADAIHSAADAFSTVLVWLGLKISQRKPNQQFPYGYYKAENLSTLLVSLLIFYAGFEIVRESIFKLSHSYDLKIPLIAISVALLDAIVMFLVGSYEVRIGKKIKAQSLIADGSESRMHLFSSSVVLLGLVASWVHLPYIEGIAGIIISFFILSVGVTSLKDSVLSLMDVSPSPDVEKKIKNILGKIQDVKSYHNLKLRKSGPFIFGEVKILIKPEIDVARAHRITEEIEQDIKGKVPQVDSFSIHVEPLEKEKINIALPVQENKGLQSLTSQSLSHSPFFAFVRIQKGNITSIDFQENPYREKTLRAGLSVGHYLLKHKVNTLLTQEIGPITFHFLGDNLVDIYKAPVGTVAEIIQMFLDHKLSLLNKPTTKKK